MKSRFFLLALLLSCVSYGQQKVKSVFDLESQKEKAKQVKQEEVLEQQFFINWLGVQEASIGSNTKSIRQKQ